MRDLLALTLAHPLRRPELPVRGWETLLAQAWQSGLIARLARQISDHGGLAEVPPRPRGYLEGALRAAERQEHEVRWEVECVRRALSQVDTPVVLLKGAAYVMAQLPAARGRLFSDVDFLVPRDRLGEVEGALLRGGWYVECHDAYDLRYYRQWMHELPPMKHARRGSAIDVHHTITPPTSRFKVDARTLFERSNPLPGHGRLHVLAPADMVLHSAVHLLQEGEFGHGLRDLLDLNDLLLDFGVQAAFWPGLLARARELRLEAPLSHALAHVQRLFGTTAPQGLSGELASMRPRGLAHAATSRLLATALRPEHPSCDSRFTPLARWLLYVRSHYLRMPLHLVVPHLLRKAYAVRFPAKR